MKHLITAECVSEGHPDKVADKISDSILTYYKIHDSQAHVACETLVAQNLIVLAGEVKSFHKATKNSLYEVVRETLKSIGYLSYACKAEFINNLVSQSPEIALGADKHAAGDQGIMHGYATAETEEKLPLVQLIAARLMAIHDVKRKEKDSPFYPDAKSQVTIDYSGNLPKIKSVTLALSHKEETDSDFLKDYALDLISEAVEGYTFLLNDNIEVTVNGTGSFVQHGPSVDCGLTGRKIVIDQIPNHVVGGGALSGKDLTKVDRSATYLCRYIAKHMVAAGISKEVSVHLAYTIGQFTPDSFRIDTHGQSKTQFTDAEISTMMKHIISTDTRDVTKMFEGTNFPHYCNYSHYFNQTAPWEVIQTPLVLEIQKTFF